MQKSNDGLFIANSVPSSQTLGPGNRGVIWVSGCSRNCRGCIAAPIQKIQSGTKISVDQYLEFYRVEYLRVDESSEQGFKVTILDFADSFDQDEKIQWKQS